MKLTRLGSLLLVVLASMASIPTISHAQNKSLHPSRTDEREEPGLTIALRPEAELTSNMVRLQDIATITGPTDSARVFKELPLAIAPLVGNRQSWDRQDIEKALAIRGISDRAFVWSGASKCTAQRIEAKEIPKPAAAQVVSASAVEAKKPSATSTPPAHSPPNVPNRTSKGTIDKSKFTPAFTNPASVTQAERIVVAAIENYLQTKTMSEGEWIVKAIVPPEHAATLLQRRQIVGISGGQPPWEGDQEFTLLINTPKGDQTISIQANVQLPDMVVAAARPLAKGYVLRESDLVWIPMPRGSTVSSEVCFSELGPAIGKQLRRNMSTRQIIKIAEVGPPNVIRAGDMVQVSVIAGGVTIQTSGRAVESGGMDDLIQVEIMHEKQSQRKRVMGRVVDDKVVEILSNGATHTDPPAPKLP